MRPKTADRKNGAFGDLLVNLHTGVDYGGGFEVGRDGDDVAASGKTAAGRRQRTWIRWRLIGRDGCAAEVEQLRIGLRDAVLLGGVLVVSANEDLVIQPEAATHHRLRQRVVREADARRDALILIVEDLRGRNQRIAVRVGIDLEVFAKTTGKSQLRMDAPGVVDEEA